MLSRLLSHGLEALVVWTQKHMWTMYMCTCVHVYYVQGLFIERCKLRLKHGLKIEMENRSRTR